MVATLFKQRNNKNKSITTITAEDNWKVVISNWLLTDNVVKLPLGKYIIAQGNIMGVFELDELEDGTRYLSLTAHLDLNNTREKV